MDSGTWHLQKDIFGGVAAATTSNRIYKVDTATFTQQSVINLPSGISPRDLAYDPVRNGFWTSTSSFGGNLQCYDTNGVAIAGAVIPTVAGGFYGIAYDGTTAGGPYLWLSKDPVPAGPSITALVRFNISGAPVRLDSAVITIPGTVGAPNLAAGGLDFRTNLIPGKTTLIGYVQGTPDKVVVYEVGTSGPPPPVGNTLVLVHDTLAASTIQRKADRDTLNKYLPALVGNYTIKGFDSTTVLPDLTTYNTIILQETGFDAAILRYLGAGARAQIKAWLLTGTSGSKKSLISIGADLAYNYNRSGSGGRDLEFSETFGKFTYKVDNGPGSVSPALIGVTIDAGNTRALTSTPPGASYWPDGCSIVAGGSSVLYRYQNHTVNDTVGAIGNVQPGYVVASIFSDPRYYVSDFRNVLSATIGWVVANGGLITGFSNPSVTNLIPDNFSLKQNYPNPFNPSTVISYSIPKSGLVTLKVYDVLGKEVASLINEVKTSGSYEYQFNGTNLSSGVYFYRLESGNFSDTKKMFLLK
ncbi:MAG: T9SS type A sorting domain-containing protein [Ignavibacteria bacterium]|nr:T9SS type A sorting domain-containing protein [Ignavibacteria bacterium]